MERVVRDKNGKATGMISLPENEYHEMVDSNEGICTECGESCDCCEPDAENYKCGSCGAHSVYGLEQLLLMGKLEFSEGPQ